MRASGPRLLHTRDLSTAAAVIGTGPAHAAPAASDAVEAQRRFLAYAAHELRGEITLQLALAEVALADPSADKAALREMGERVVAACERQERLLEALLTLGRSECGRLRREPVDLAATAANLPRVHAYHRLGSTFALAPAERPATGSWSGASSRTWSKTPSVTTLRAAGSRSARTPPQDAPCSRSRTPDP